MGGLLKAILVPADSSQPIQLVTVVNEWEKLAAAVGAEWMERVTVTQTMKLVVDEEGMLTSRPVNGRLSHLFYPGRIYGDALILSEGYVQGEPDFVSITDKDLALATDKLWVSDHIPERMIPWKEGHRDNHGSTDAH